MEQFQNQPPKNRKWIILVVMIFLGFFVISALPFLSPLLFEWRAGDRSDRILDEVIESIKPAAERDYKFHDPSQEALKRTIDCKKLSAYQDKLPIINPLCLNLYRTDPEEIDKKVAEGKYDRVILYGEKIIWNAPVYKKGNDQYEKIGKVIIDSAKFNDQITIPSLMKLYGFSDLGFVNKLTPEKIFPFPALYFRLSNNEEVQKVCSKSGSPQTAGCASGMWSTIIPDHVLGEPMSLSNQRVWRISDEKASDFLAYDYHWPKNCLTEETMLHEASHLFLYAHRVYNPSDVLVSTKYFNEHLADAVKVMATDTVCGEGSVSNFRDKSRKATSLAGFNAKFPPAKMGSAWPEPEETCKQGLLNEWNRFMEKENFEKQFTFFSEVLKDWMKEGETISNEKGLANFLIKLSGDGETKNNLQYRGCQL